MILITVFILISLRWSRGIFRDIADYFVPWSIQKRFQTAMFLIAMGDLIHSGYSFPRALSKTGEYANNYLLSYIVEIEDHLAQNMSVGNALEVGLISKNLMGFVKDFSLMDDFSTKLIEIGERGFTETVTFIKVIAVIIGLLGIIGTAGTNAYIALSMRAIQDQFMVEIRNR